MIDQLGLAEPQLAPSLAGDVGGLAARLAAEPARSTRAGTLPATPDRTTRTAPAGVVPS